MKLMVALVALGSTTASITSGCTDEASRPWSRIAAEPTALDQSSEPEDLATVGRVRRALVLAPDLSMRAKNVVVIVRGGIVTLRGDVASRRDHERVVARVLGVPDVVGIEDRLEHPEGA